MECGQIRSTERDGEDRSSDVESATNAPETVNSESGIAAILVMMERNRQEDRKREREDRERENERRKLELEMQKAQMDLLQEELKQSKNEKKSNGKIENQREHQTMMKTEMLVQRENIRIVYYEEYQRSQSMMNETYILITWKKH